MTRDEQRLLRHLAIAVLIKLIVLTALWWIYVRDVRVSVTAEDGAAQVGDSISSQGVSSDFSTCLSFLWRDRLFCGDLLTMDACPYQPCPALPESLWNSVTQKVFTLPAETLLFSGHAHLARSVSNVLEQRRWHPWFAGASRDEFLSRLAPQSVIVNQSSDPRQQGLIRREP